MKLHELAPAAGSRKKGKRLGRGLGSGRGKTAGRGSKGQNSRAGGGVRLGFEGGQMPIQRRLPKRGFTNIFGKRYAVVNVRDLARFESGSIVDAEALRRAGLVKGRWHGVKLLGQGEVAAALTVKLHKISPSAQRKIESAGGTVEVV